MRFLQLLGFSHGFGDSMEYGTGTTRCLFNLPKIFTPSTKNYVDSHYRRLGNVTFLFCSYFLDILFHYLMEEMDSIQVLSFLSLAGACSTASVTELLIEAGEAYCPFKLCRRYQLSAATAFFSWFLSFGSSLFNLWLLPSLYPSPPYI